MARAILKRTKVLIMDEATARFVAYNPVVHVFDLLLAASIMPPTNSLAVPSDSKLLVPLEHLTRVNIVSSEFAGSTILTYDIPPFSLGLSNKMFQHCPSPKDSHRLRPGEYGVARQVS